MTGTYTKVTDSLTGAVHFIRSPTGQSVLAGVSNWLGARSQETTTHIGMATGAALAPLIIGTITSALAGDIPGAVTSGIPALIGIMGALSAIITPTPKGLTDAQIKSHVAALSHDELISLLQQSDTGIVQSAAHTG